MVLDVPKKYYLVLTYPKKKNLYLSTVGEKNQKHVGPVCFYEEKVGGRKITQTNK
jgi:hypothetical protein